jgi:ketosteroid isomerase-like protein
MAVATQYKEVIAQFGRATSAFVRSETLHVDHDLAYESGYAEARFLNGAVCRGRFSTVWKRQDDGHWKIFRNISLPAAP